MGARKGNDKKGLPSSYNFAAAKKQKFTGEKILHYLLSTPFPALVRESPKSPLHKQSSLTYCLGDPKSFEKRKRKKGITDSRHLPSCFLPVRDVWGGKTRVCRWSARRDYCLHQREEGSTKKGKRKRREYLAFIINLYRQPSVMWEGGEMNLERREKGERSE